jgi:hypothetical protein
LFHMQLVNSGEIFQANWPSYGARTYEAQKWQQLHIT